MRKEDETLLLQAAREGNLSTVLTLLRRSVYIDYRNAACETPLFIASKHGNQEIVNILLSHSAEVNAKQINGETPLHAASCNGHVEVVKNLLTHGGLSNTADTNGITPLHSASSGGYIDIVKELLTSKAFIHSRDNYGRTAVHCASKHGFVDIVKMLLDHGTAVICRDKDGRTPLHEASGNGHVEVVKELLIHGGQVNCKSLDGSTAIYDALWQGHIHIAKQLLELDADVHIVDWNGTTPLHVACISTRANMEIIKLLLTRGSNVNAKDKNGDTPLHHACFWGHHDIVTVLIANRASLNATNNCMSTPLHLASKRGRVDILKTLLNANADMTLANKDGRTAFDFGNQPVKHFLKGYRSNSALSHHQSPFQLISLDVENTEHTAALSQVAFTANSILRIASNIQIHGQMIRSICLRIRCIVEHILSSGVIYQELPLLPALKEIHDYWKSLHQVLPLKLKLDITQKEKLQNIADHLGDIQTLLLNIGDQLRTPLNVLVMTDMRNEIGQMIDKMQNLDKNLVDIRNTSDERSRGDKLVELMVQIERGWEHYQAQVALGNFCPDINFEGQVKTSKMKIINQVNIMRQSEELPESFAVDKIEPWILACDDVVFNPDDLETALGRGGFATVFKGTYHGQTVAVKRFSELPQADAAELENLIAKEIKDWKGISNEQFILSLIGISTRPKLPILVSELCASNIRRYIRDWPETLLPLVYQFACGLKTIHKANIMHRDIKGDNVLVTFQKTVAVADFGLSRTAATFTRATTKDKAEGTLNWMSPEQFLTPRLVTSKSDVWSFGMTLWEILYNDTPFRGCSENEFKTEIFVTDNDRPEKPEHLDPTLEPLWNLIRRCWQLDPNLRPTAHEIVDYLEEHYSGQLELHEEMSTPAQEELDHSLMLFLSKNSSSNRSDESDLTVTTFDELIRLILADPNKEWLLFNNYYLCPELLGTGDQNIFRARNQRQPQKQFVVELSEDDEILENIERQDHNGSGQVDSRCLTENIDWGEWTVGNYKCYARIISMHPSTLPCVCKIDGVSYPLPQGAMLRRMPLSLSLLCEMRDSSPCEYFPHDDRIQVEAQSYLTCDVLPILKTSFLVLKTIGLVSSYNISFGVDFNFDTSGGPLIEDVLNAIERIYGQIDLTTSPRLVNIITALESGDLEDNEVGGFVNEIKQIISEHREQNSNLMSRILPAIGCTRNGDIMGGLKQQIIKSSTPYGCDVRWVCKKHIACFDDLCCTLTMKNEREQSPRIYSIKSATEVIRRALEDTEGDVSEILAAAHTIFALALELKVFQQSVLTTGLMVERIVRYIQQNGPLSQAVELLSVLYDVKYFLETTSRSTNFWFRLDYTQDQTKIQYQQEGMIRLRDRLLSIVDKVPVNMKVQVLGNIDDLRTTNGKTMEKLLMHLETIMKLSDLHLARDRLYDFAIQVRRRFEYYESQLYLDNISRAIDFEDQIKSTQLKIEHFINFMIQTKRFPKSFLLNNRFDPWMLSSDDVIYNPDDFSSCLGRGSSATVFRGKYLGQDVAVKRFDHIFTADSTDLEMLIAKELKAWMDISHEPYILTLVGACTKIKTPIIVCELCDTNVRRYVRDNPEALLSSVYQFARGLYTIHKANIIHRDLKGDNVLITFQKTVAIADFGLSRTVKSLERTRTGVRGCGTLYWMSPEQYFAPRRVTTKSDVWSFGITLWEILCNEIPFQGCNEYEIAEEVFLTEGDRPEKPEDLDMHLEPLWTLITMCWQLDPTLRPSAGEIVEYLETHYSTQLEHYL